MKTPVFEGSCVALVTPFTKSNEINFNELERLIERQIENKTNAITICGTTGEASTLNIGEYESILKFTNEVVNKRIPIIAGSGSNDTFHAILLSKLAEKHECQAVLLVTPYYNKTNQNGLINHYNSITNELNIPSILYNVPSRTGMTFTPETYLELSKNPKINGVKEASGDFSLIAKTIALCGDNLNIWSGNDDQIVPAMSLGAKGVISVASNIVPEIITALTTFCLQNDYSQATALQSEYLELINVLFSDVNPIPVKEALDFLDFDVGFTRLPLFEMDCKSKQILWNVLQKYKLR